MGNRFGGTELKKEKWFVIIWLFLAIAIAAMIVFPIGLKIIRLGIVLGIVLLLGSGIYFFWKNKVVRFILILVVGIIGLVMLIPGNDGNAENLRATYVSTLEKYEGVKYTWGGENKLGIDCAALVREGYIHANAKIGIKTLNPKLIKRAFFIWWNDCSADALGKEYKGMTTLIIRLDSMKSLDYTTIKQGDIIVAEKGFHTFVYIGDRLWLEANPEKGKVIKVTSELKEKEWASVPIKLMRWRNL